MQFFFDKTIKTIIVIIVFRLNIRENIIMANALKSTREWYFIKRELSEGT